MKPNNNPDPEQMESALYSVLAICILWALLIAPLTVPGIVQALGVTP